jgi:hypothetical protein
MRLEPYPTHYLNKFIKPWWTALDVGANCEYMLSDV